MIHGVPTAVRVSAAAVVTSISRLSRGGFGAGEGLSARRWRQGSGGRSVATRGWWQGGGGKSVAAIRWWQGGGEVVVARPWGRGAGGAGVARCGGGTLVVGMCPPKARRVLGCVLGSGGVAVGIVACAQRCLAPAPPLRAVQLGELVCTGRARLCPSVSRGLPVREFAGAEHELCARCVRGG